MNGDIDLKAAINAVSDVIQNRPRPLREFDQIYMKAGDMVLQSEFVAEWANDKRLAFCRRRRLNRCLRCVFEGTRNSWLRPVKDQGI